MTVENSSYIHASTRMLKLTGQVRMTEIVLVEYRLEMIACIVGDESFAIFLFNKYFNCYRK